MHINLSAYLKAERFFYCLNEEDIRIIRGSFLRNLAPAARMFGGFASSCEAKSASMSAAPSPSHSERAAYAF
ncbi:hypothetical protein COI93_15090 [Bacillus cereus]|uniref:Uncharacterized protein n=1 Tax=Bacillus cereus TaxID=1396 RepID=A0A2B0LZU6_BACCE|nr:hypothetical protein COI93_15090 [Bacillus cereus]